MRYTTLRVTGRGVAFLALHEARLAAEGPEARDALRRFARDASPGVYAIRADAGELDVRRLAGSRLSPGMPVRWRVSPFQGRGGAFPKPAPPSPYDAVREPGVATLLTSSDGGEVYESCVAAVLGWDGERFVCVPEDRPRVDSVAEAAVLAALPCVRAPLPVADRMPLVLVNAVAGPCVVATGRPPLPPEPLSRLERLFADLSRRP